MFLFYGHKLETVGWHKNCCSSYYPRVITDFRRHMASLAQDSLFTHCCWPIIIKELSSEYRAIHPQFSCANHAPLAGRDRVWGLQTKWQQVELTNNNASWLSQLPLCPVFAMSHDSLTFIILFTLFLMERITFYFKIFTICMFVMFYRYKIFRVTLKRKNLCLTINYIAFISATFRYKKFYSNGNPFGCLHSCT